MNTLLNGIKKETNVGYTENGAVKRLSTLNAVYDLFAMGGAMRDRNAADQITLFKKAYKQDATLALKCLFYLRAVRGIGQGERNFFRNCTKWLADYDTDAVVRNMQNIAEFGRFDDYYCLIGTKAEKAMWEYLKEVITNDLNILNKTKGKGAISLLGKWLASENTSSKDTRARAKKTRKVFGMTARDYRQMLTRLRKQIRVVEAAMSANDWNSIDFSTVPSKAGLNYKQAFARHCGARYENFIKDENTTVKTGALAPYEVVEKAIDACVYGYIPLNNDINRLAINKYWENLPNWLADAPFNALCVVDTSGSMIGRPMNVAISLGMYCAERAKGPFANHYISFASRPQLIEVEGVDFVDKVKRIYDTNLVDNTNIEAVFDLLLDTIVENGCTQEDVPDTLLIVSDQEFDQARGENWWSDNDNLIPQETLMETIRKRWERRTDIVMPKLVYWNVNCRDANIPEEPKDGITFVSGFSPSIFQALLTGKTSFDLMLEVLNSEQFAIIQ